MSRLGVVENTAGQVDMFPVLMEFTASHSEQISKNITQEKKKYLKNSINLLDIGEEKEKNVTSYFSNIFLRKTVEES